MPMKNPTHPWRIVCHDCLEPLGLSITAGAKILGVTRQTLNNVVNCKSRVCYRLTMAFGSTPETWLRMQLPYDLAQARKNERNVKLVRQFMPENLGELTRGSARLRALHRLTTCKRIVWEEDA